MKSVLRSDIPEEWIHLSQVFAALGDEERQRILLLFEAGAQLNAGDIARASTLSRTTVSHHLKLLCNAGIIERSRHGREIHFRLCAATLIGHLQNVIDYLEDHR
jgi:ArsR family transcriptional regulator